jgi:hypothetical protein
MLNFDRQKLARVEFYFEVQVADPSKKRPAVPFEMEERWAS